MKFITNTAQLTAFHRWYSEEYDKDIHWLMVTRLPIVGSHFHNISPYRIQHPVSVYAEPENPSDAEAICVVDRGCTIGYVTRQHKHLIIGEVRPWSENDDWEDLPKLVSTADDWALYHVTDR